MKLSRTQRENYERDGFLVVEGLVSAGNFKKLRERVDEMQEQILHSSSTGKGVEFVTEPPQSATTVAARPALRKLVDLATVDDFFRSMASTPDILDIVSELTGGAESIMLYNDQVFLKPAFCGSEKPQHQDNSYFRMIPSTAGVTCWMALDDSTIENGCLHYVPGSHKLGLIKHRAIEDTPHLVPDDPTSIPPEVPVPVPAGACIFHHLLALHSSKANQSAHPRRAWALHYANRGAESCVKPWEQMLKLR